MARTFTVEQANRMLPLVSRIARDIVEQHARWREMVVAFEVAVAGARTVLPEEAEQLQRSAQALATEIDGYIAELRELGVEAKGFDSGLVDFPGEIDGRPVYLCWQIGEPSVQYWHDIDAGFAGRRPIDSTATAGDRSS